MAFHIFPTKGIKIDRRSVVANIYWLLVNALVSVLFLVTLAGLLPAPAIFLGMSFLSMTSPMLIVLNMVYEINYSVFGLALPFTNVVIAGLIVGGVRTSGHHPELAEYTGIEIVFVVNFIFSLFLFPFPTLIMSHYEQKISRLTFIAYARFIFSNAYILFLIILPDFSVLLLNQRQLTWVETYLSASFIFSVSTVGILRADVEMRLQEGTSLLGYFYHPRYLLMLLSDGCLVLSSGILYAIRIYSVDLIIQNQVVIGITQLVLMLLSIGQKISAVYYGRLFSVTYTSQKRSSTLTMQGLPASELEVNRKAEREEAVEV